MSIPCCRCCFVQYKLSRVSWCNFHEDGCLCTSAILLRRERKSIIKCPKFSFVPHKIICRVGCDNWGLNWMTSLVWETWKRNFSSRPWNICLMWCSFSVNVLFRQRRENSMGRCRKCGLVWTPKYSATKRMHSRIFFMYSYQSFVNSYTFASNDM